MSWIRTLYVAGKIVQSARKPSESMSFKEVGCGCLAMIGVVGVIGGGAWLMNRSMRIDDERAERDQEERDERNYRDIMDASVGIPREECDRLVREHVAQEARLRGYPTPLRTQRR
jgi:hypothetical protein